MAAKRRGYLSLPETFGDVEGIFTHFATADEVDDSVNSGVN